MLRRRSATDIVPTPFFLTADAVLGSAMWLGGPTLAALQLVPLWSTNFIGRASSVFAFIVAVCVGAGLDRLLRGETPSSDDHGRPGRLDARATVRIRLAGTLCVGVAAAVTAAIVRVAREQGFEQHVLATAIVPTLLLLTSTTVVVVAARGSKAARVASMLVLAVLIVAQSTSFAVTLLPTSREDFYPDTATHRYLAEHLGGDRYGAPVGRCWPRPASSTGCVLR